MRKIINRSQDEERKIQGENLEENLKLYKSLSNE